MEALRDFGLSEKEVAIYLECLKTGATGAQRLSKTTQLRRTTTYDTLESLRMKGMVVSFEKDKKTVFEAVDPKRLPDMLKEKERKLKEALPGLLALRATATEKPSLHLFEGLKGIYTLLDQIYEEKELLQYGSARIAKAMLISIPESFARRRVERGIKLRAVFERSNEALFRLEDPKIAKVTKLRFIDSFSAMQTITIIAGDKVATLSLGGELLGVLIEDKEIAQTHRMIFELLWAQAKE